MNQTSGSPRGMKRTPVSDTKTTKVTKQDLFVSIVAFVIFVSYDRLSAAIF